MVQAYRVERSFGYKIKVDDHRNITSFDWSKLGTGIDISFALADHSEYFADEHQNARGLRVVTFTMNDGFWNGIKFLKKFGSSQDQDLGKAWLKSNGWKSGLKVPSGSDGANLNSFVKKTALHFAPEWEPVLMKGFVRGSASVAYADEEKELFPAKDDDGEFYGGMTITDIKSQGLKLAPKLWDQI